MAEHIWIMPWMALIFSAAAVILTLLNLVRKTPIPNNGMAATIGSVFSPVPVWIIAVIAGIFVELKIGTAAGVDYAGARGLLLGALFGVFAIFLARKIGSLLNMDDHRERCRKLMCVSILSLPVLCVTLGRMWLTHGELTGNIAVGLGMALTIILLLFVPSEQNSDPVIAGASRSLAVAYLILTITLLSVVQLGFTRATMITDAYWPDIPLVLTGLAGFIAAVLPLSLGNRYSRIAAVTNGIVILLMGFYLNSSLTKHEGTLLKMLLMGMLGFALIVLIRRFTGNEKNEASSLGRYGLVFVLLFAMLTVAYTYWAGYGIGMILIAGWVVISPFVANDLIFGDIIGSRPNEILASLAFGAFIALHRIYALAAVNNHDNAKVFDTWSLVGIAAGMLLPAVIAGFSQNQRWPLVLEPLRWIIALIVPLLCIVLLFTTQSLDAVIIGAAVSVGAALIYSQKQINPLIITAALFCALLVMQLEPMMINWKAPSRRVRVELLVVLAVTSAVVQIGKRQNRELAVEGR